MNGVASPDSALRLMSILWSLCLATGAYWKCVNIVRITSPYLSMVLQTRSEKGCFSMTDSRERSNVTAQVQQMWSVIQTECFFRSVLASTIRTAMSKTNQHVHLFRDENYFRDIATLLRESNHFKYCIILEHYLQILTIARRNNNFSKLFIQSFHQDHLIGILTQLGMNTLQRLHRNQFSRNVHALHRLRW